MRRSTAALMAAAAAALLLLMVASLAAACTPINSVGERSEEEVETRWMFKEWMIEYSKTYNSVGEEEHRYAVFKENRRHINQHNADADAGVYSYRLGLNVFADLTDEELSSWNLGGPHFGTEDDRQNLEADNEDALESVGWRKKGRGDRGGAASS